MVGFPWRSGPGERGLSIMKLHLVVELLVRYTDSCFKFKIIPECLKKYLQEQLFFCSGGPGLC